MKKLIIGNWKMNLGVGDASLYLHKLADMIPAQRTVDVVLAPTILTLQSLSLQVNRRQFKLLRRIVTGAIRVLTPVRCQPLN